MEDPSHIVNIPKWLANDTIGALLEHYKEQELILLKRMWDSIYYLPLSIIRMRVLQ